MIFIRYVIYHYLTISEEEKELEQEEEEESKCLDEFLYKEQILRMYDLKVELKKFKGR